LVSTPLERQRQLLFELVKRSALKGTRYSTSGRDIKRFSAPSSSHEALSCGMQSGERET
jgi:hypothetical protein